MTTYRSYSNGKVYEFKKGKDIGSGASGAVGEVQGRPEFVYKEIPLLPKPGDWVALTKEMRIKGTFRELWALKKLKLLEGYIRTKNSIIVIMPKIKGIPEWVSLPYPGYDPRKLEHPPKGPSYVTDDDNNIYCKDENGYLFEYDEQRVLATFKALLELNHQGIYHADPSPENSLIYQEDGKLKANLIDFAHAKEYSRFNETQWGMFYSTRLIKPPYVKKSLLLKLHQARREFEAKHQMAYYATMGFYLMTGIGVICVFGLSSLLFWQFIRSYISSQIIHELGVWLDNQDLYCARRVDVEMTQDEKIALNRHKTLVNLGYILINIYTLGNLCYSVPNLQLISNLSKSLEIISKANSGSLMHLPSNLIFQGLIPALNNIVLLIKNQQYVELDKVLADITYLYLQIGIAAKSFANMLEKVPPADYLLKAMEVKYTYNPALVFAYAKTKTKELFYHSEGIPKEELVEKMMTDKSKAENKVNVP